MSLLSELRAGLGRWASQSGDDVTDEMMAKALHRSGLGAPASEPQEPLNVPGGMLDALASAGPPATESRLMDSPTLLDRVREGLSKAVEATGFPQPTKEMPRSMFYDPYAVLDWGGWRQRPSALAFSTLKTMSEQTPPIAAIINHRQNQVSAFARPQQGEYDRGFRIILRERRDSRKQMSKGELKESAKIERYIEQTGVLRDGERIKDRDSFRTFTKKFTRDQLYYDQACFEIMRDRVGRPSQFKMLPSETIYPAVADLDHLDPKDIRDRISHVQVFQQTPIAEYSPDDLAFCIMNPRSGLESNGFGFPPVEVLVQTVTAWLFGFGHNQKFFQQGSAIKGFINIKGAIPDRQLRAFRRQWYSMISGAANAWKTPILNADDVSWNSMHSTNRDMEFSGWMDWLTKLICAVYGIDPVELNFNFGASGGGSSLFESRPNAHEVLESKDKGLRPLLTHIEDVMNQELIWPINPDFEFSYVGFDAKAEEKDRDADIAAGKSWVTVNENRKKRNMKPLENGDIILDPVYMQAVSAAQQEQQAEEEGADDGGFDFGGFGNDDGEQDQGPPGKGKDKPDDKMDKQGEGKPSGQEATDRLAASLAEVLTLRKADFEVDDDATARRRWLPGANVG